MDVNEYISSGILEAYALGSVSSQEKKEVECMSHIYPEIKIELDNIMLSIEKMAMAHKINPPVDVKSKLFAQLKNLPVAETSTVKIVPLKSKNYYSSFNKLLAAACIVLAISMVALYFYETSNAVDLTKKLNLANETLTQRDFQISQLEEKKSFSDSEIAMFRNPDFKTVFLKSTNNKPADALAIVCCNTKEKKTVFAVSNLPEAPIDKEYQLWAIVDGKPVDMGMIKADSLSVGFFEVKNIESAQAYAITLEKKGGVKSPTIEEMYVIGQMQ